MEISLMRSRITIQKNTVVTDSVGNHTCTWEDWYSCYAYANMSQNISGAGEEKSAGQTVVKDSYVFTVRYCSKLSDLTSDGYRILFNGNIYDISKVDDYQFRHETLKLTAERVQR